MVCINAGRMGEQLRIVQLYCNGRLTRKTISVSLIDTARDVQRIIAEKLGAVQVLSVSLVYNWTTYKVKLDNTITQPLFVREVERDATFGINYTSRQTNLIEIS